MEVSERVAAGAPVATIFDHAAVGLASQLFVAALLTVAVYLIGRGAAAAGRLFLPIPPEDRRDAFAVAPLDFLPVRLAILPCGSRGPPLS